MAVVSPQYQGRAKLTVLVGGLLTAGRCCLLHPVVQKASVPIKAGEVAWLVGGGTASPVLVGSGPVTKEAWRAMSKRAEERRRRIRLDFSDDCYYVYEYDNGHAHPPVWSVFPYAGKMSKRNMDRLLKTKKWYDEGCPGA